MLSFSEIKMNLAAHDPMQTCASVPELVTDQVRQRPDQQAVVMEGQGLTYRELGDLSDRFAAHLSGLGVESGALVPVLAHRSIDTIVAILGVLKAGAAYVPIDPDYPADRIRLLLEETQGPVLLTHTALADEVRGMAGSLVCLDEGGWKSQAPQPVPSGIAGPSDLAYVIYTSGSTGRPKGVAMPHRALTNLLSWHRRAFPQVPGTRTLQFASISFDVSFQEIFTAWSEGGTLVLIDEERRRDPEALLVHLQEHAINRLFVPFVALHQLAEVARDTGCVPTDLKDVFTAGEQLQVGEAIREFFGKLPSARLHNHYGPTETHVVTSHTLTGSPDTWPELPPIGTPVDGCRIHILSETLQPVPGGEEGEIHIAGECVARGYWRREDLTSERFLPNPFCEDGNGRMYRTGDIGRLRPDGAIEFLGRKDDQVKIRGFRVELGEVEHILRDHPSVKDCAVGLCRTGSQDQLHAFVVPRGECVTAGDLRRHLSEKLPAHMVPVGFHEMRRLPLTPSGKVDRKALPSPDGMSGRPTEAISAPVTELERQIWEVWSAVLGVADFGVTESFFDVGGSSLLVVQVQRRLREQLKRDVPIQQLFKYPSVRALASVLDQPQSEPQGRLSRIAARAGRQRQALARGARSGNLEQA